MEYVALAFAIVGLAAVVYGVTRQASANREIVRDLLDSNRDILDRAVAIREAHEVLLSDTVRKIGSASDQAYALAQMEIQRDIRIMDTRDEPPRQSHHVAEHDEEDEGVVESEWSDTVPAVG